MKKIVITGAAGFLGRHLANELKSNYDIIGIDTKEIIPEKAILWKKINSVQETEKVLKSNKCDILIHSAFINKKPKNISGENYLKQVIDNNFSIFKLCGKLHIKLLLISSSAVYGEGYKKKSVRENNPISPISIYGLAKSIQESLVEYCSLTYNLKYCIVRPFNIVGPGQQRGMLFPDWVYKVKTMGKNGKSFINVQTLSTIRDFVDVRDVVKALNQIINNFKPGSIYNVANGKAVNLIDIINELKNISGFDFSVVEEKIGLPSNNISCLIGSINSIKKDYGWLPIITWQQSLYELFNETK